MAGQQRKCAQCNEPAPESNTQFTLITNGSGWRLSRRVDDKGKFVIEWRCPNCVAGANSTTGT